MPYCCTNGAGVFLTSGARRPGRVAPAHVQEEAHLQQGHERLQEAQEEGGRRVRQARTQEAPATGQEAKKSQVYMYVKHTACFYVGTPPPPPRSRPCPCPSLSGGRLSCHRGNNHHLFASVLWYSLPLTLTDWQPRAKERKKGLVSLKCK